MSTEAFNAMTSAPGARSAYWESLVALACHQLRDPEREPGEPRHPLARKAVRKDRRRAGEQARRGCRARRIQQGRGTTRSTAVAASSSLLNRITARSLP